MLRSPPLLLVFHLWSFYVIPSPSCTGYMYVRPTTLSTQVHSRRQQHPPGHGRRQLLFARLLHGNPQVYVWRLRFCSRGVFECLSLRLWHLRGLGQHGRCHHRLEHGDGHSGGCSLRCVFDTIGVVWRPVFTVWPCSMLGSAASPVSAAVCRRFPPSLLSPPLVTHTHYTSLLVCVWHCAGHNDKAGCIEFNPKYGMIASACSTLCFWVPAEG